MNAVLYSVTFWGRIQTERKNLALEVFAFFWVNAQIATAALLVSAQKSCPSMRHGEALQRWQMSSYAKPCGSGSWHVLPGGTDSDLRREIAFEEGTRMYLVMKATYFREKEKWFPKHSNGTQAFSSPTSLWLDTEREMVVSVSSQNCHQNHRCLSTFNMFLYHFSFELQKS